MVDVPQLPGAKLIPWIPPFGGNLGSIWWVAGCRPHNDTWTLDVLPFWGSAQHGVQVSIPKRRDIDRAGRV